MVLIPSRTLTLFSPERAASLAKVFSPMDSASPAPKAMCLEVPNGGSEAPSRIHFARGNTKLWYYDDPSALSDDELLGLAGPALLALTDYVFQRVLEGRSLRRKGSELSQDDLFLLTDGTVGLLVPQLAHTWVEKNPSLRFGDNSPVAEIILPECEDNHAALRAMERARTWLPIARSLLRLSDSQLTNIEAPSF